MDHPRELCLRWCVRITLTIRRTVARRASEGQTGNSLASASGYGADLPTTLQKLFLRGRLFRWRIWPTNRPMVPGIVDHVRPLPEGMNNSRFQPRVVRVVDER